MENRDFERRPYAPPAIVIETIIADAIMCSGGTPGDDDPADPPGGWTWKPGTHYAGGKHGKGGGHGGHGRGSR